MGVHLGVRGFIPLTLFALSGACEVIPGSPSWLTTLQPLALVTSPKLGLQHSPPLEEEVNVLIDT
jgi:hypothetical protein